MKRDEGYACREVVSPRARQRVRRSGEHCGIEASRMDGRAIRAAVRSVGKVCVQTGEARRAASVPGGIYDSARSEGRGVVATVENDGGAAWVKVQDPVGRATPGILGRVAINALPGANIVASTESWPSKKSNRGARSSAPRGCGTSRSSCKLGRQRTASANVYSRARRATSSMRRPISGEMKPGRSFDKRRTWFISC